MSSIGQPGKASTSVPSLEAWLLYGVKTAGLVELDPAAYLSLHRPNVDPELGRDVPKTEWLCQRPNGGLHIHKNVRRVDVHIAEQPIPRVELNAIRGYGLKLIKANWLDLISDLINPESVFVGDVILKGEILPTGAPSAASPSRPCTPGRRADPPPVQIAATRYLFPTLVQCTSMIRRSRESRCSRPVLAFSYARIWRSRETCGGRTALSTPCVWR